MARPLFSVSRYWVGTRVCTEGLILASVLVAGIQCHWKASTVVAAIGTQTKNMNQTVSRSVCKGIDQYKESDKGTPIRTN